MPPRNEAYYYAAYAITAAVYALYAASIWWRSRRVRERLAISRPDDART